MQRRSRERRLNVGTTMETMGVVFTVAPGTGDPIPCPPTLTVYRRRRLRFCGSRCAGARCNRAGSGATLSETAALLGLTLTFPIIFAGVLSAEPPAEPPADPPPSAAAAASTPVPGATAELEGLWPSPRMLDLMLNRWAEEICAEYDLNEAQSAWTREKFAERWGAFLREHRPLLQPLANEFIEMRIDLHPPSKERVQSWAERTAPLLEQVREQARQGQDDFRGILRPLQRAKFEVDALQMSVGLALAEQKLKQWRQGEFEKDHFWEPPPADRSERREYRRRRRARIEQEERAMEETIKPVDQIAVEMDLWEKYVADAVMAFNFDEGQRTTALSCLSELRDRAIAHRDRRRDDIAQLERRLENHTGSEGELTDLKKQLAELYGPIDDMFQELKTRIERIPTVEQRAGAEERRPAKEMEKAADPGTPLQSPPEPPGPKD